MRVFLPLSVRIWLDIARRKYFPRNARKRANIWIRYQLAKLENCESHKFSSTDRLLVLLLFTISLCVPSVFLGTVINVLRSEALQIDSCYCADGIDNQSMLTHADFCRLIDSVHMAKIRMNVVIAFPSSNMYLSATTEYNELLEQLQTQFVLRQKCLQAPNNIWSDFFSRSLGYVFMFAVGHVVSAYYLVELGFLRWFVFVFCPFYVVPIPFYILLVVSTRWKGFDSCSDRIEL